MHIRHCRLISSYWHILHIRESSIYRGQKLRTSFNYHDCVDCLFESTILQFLDYYDWGPNTWILEMGSDDRVSLWGREGYIARAEKQEPSSIWLGRGGVVIETWALGFCSDSPLSGEVEFSIAKGLKARTWLGGGGVVIETWGLMAGSEVRLDWQEGGSPASASVPTLPNTKRFVIKKQN